MKKFLSLSVVLFILFSLFSCAAPQSGSNATEQNTTTENTTASNTTTENTTVSNTEVNTTTQASSNELRTITLATTTSTQDSGLLDYLLPEFKKDKNIEVKVLAKGTGEAIKLAQNGDADCLLVHAKSQEEEFVNNGYGTKRIQLMYNDFILLGPKDDPLKIKEQAPDNIKVAFGLLAEGGSKFVSRGDGSGTETKEKSIWTAVGVEPSGDFYVSAGKGMGDVLQMASEMKAYTFSDRATYLSMKDKLDLDVVCEKDPSLNNQYSIIRLNYDKLELKNKDASEEFIQWMFSEKAINMISEFGKDKYGESLFTPNPDPID